MAVVDRAGLEFNFFSSAVVLDLRVSSGRTSSREKALPPTGAGEPRPCLGQLDVVLEAVVLGHE